MTRPRIGLFGGTFDPPHVGHVAALRAAAASGRFDQIVVMVAGDPYQKSIDREVRDAAERLEMAQSAFDALELVTVSALEVERQGPSYTIDTVEILLRDAQSVDILVGADVATHLPEWHRAPELADLVKVGVFPRPGQAIQFPPSFICYEISMMPVDVSSSEVRDIKDEALLPKAVPSEIIPFLAPSAE